MLRPLVFGPFRRTVLPHILCTPFSQAIHLQDEPLIHELLASLNSREAEEAWARFLDNYAPVILQTVRLAERESDAVGECFLFVCEGLAKDRFRRLRQFRTAGPARFSTWLRVVARNLCVDWRRKKFGRRYNFGFVSRLPAPGSRGFSLSARRGNIARGSIPAFVAPVPRAVTSGCGPKRGAPL